MDHLHSLPYLLIKFTDKASHHHGNSSHPKGENTLIYPTGREFLSSCKLTLEVPSLIPKNLVGAQLG
jgi:hypothetical protein